MDNVTVQLKNERGTVLQESRLDVLKAPELITVIPLAMGWALRMLRRGRGWRGTLLSRPHRMTQCASCLQVTTLQLAQFVKVACQMCSLHLAEVLVFPPA